MSDIRVSPVLSPAAARRIDQECDRFEAAWNAGRRPDPADALDTLAEPERSALLRQLLLLDWAVLRDRPDFQALLAESKEGRSNQSK